MNIHEDRARHDEARSQAVFDVIVGVLVALAIAVWWQLS